MCGNGRELRRGGNRDLKSEAARIHDQELELWRVKMEEPATIGKHGSNDEMHDLEKGERRRASDGSIAHPLDSDPDIAKRRAIVR